MKAGTASTAWLHAHRTDLFSRSAVIITIGEATSFLLSRCARVPCAIRYVGEKACAGKPRCRGIRFASMLHHFKSSSVCYITFSHRKETLPLSSRQPDCSRLSKQLWGPSVELNLQMSVVKIHCVPFDTESI